MFYKLLHIIADFVLRFLFFLSVHGSQYYKSVKSGFILMSNHKSNWDPVILGDAIRKRPVVYMAKEELFKKKTAARFLRLLYAIPLTRGSADLTAVKTALRVLAKGDILGIFPEGTRTKTGKIGPFEPGAALLSLRGNVPVVPVYIKGGYKLFHKVSVYFGEPVYLRRLYPGRVNGAVIQEATDLLRNRMLDLEREAYESRK